MEGQEFCGTSLRARALARTTGAALILVDDDAENMIVVSPGANDRLTPALLPERLLDGEGDLLLDFLGPQRRGGGVNLHLDRRGIRKGVDIEEGERESAQHRERHRSQNDQEPVPQ